jgi:RimJ/RimL family protein N-acetyltransferase
MTMNAKLRPLEMNDLDNMMTWVNDPTVIGNFQNFKMPISRDDEAKYLEKLLASEIDKTFAVEAEDGKYIGNIGINQIHWPSRNARLSLIIGNKNYWGKGYAQSALQEVIRLSFDHYNLHKLWLIVWEENKKAQHIYKKVGFQEEGVLRDEYFHKGVFHNMIRMSILENEYRAKSDSLESAIGPSSSKVVA